MNEPLRQQLGPYRLERVVGRGGMGTVYAATDGPTGERVAVKILSPALASDPSFRNRFAAEIESLKTLQHPNIVQMYGYGEQDGLLYYSMELIEGNSLQDELRRGHRFGWREVTRIAVDICAALKHAHDHGVIHRDLKPANLLYTSQEKVKLLDFGIAKLFGNTGLTTDSVLGTADYMAPEQAEGKPVGPRTDLYSLGSLMYALLAGRPPFQGSSVAEVVHKVRYESPIPVSRLATDVPIELDHLIEQLLEKNPQKRIPTAMATAHRLRAMEHALTIRDTSEPTPDTIETTVSTPPAVAAEAAQPSPPHLTHQETVHLKPDAPRDGEVERLIVSTRDPEIASGPDHFTTVNRQHSGDGSQRFPWQALKMGLLLAALLSIGYAAIHWAGRPPSADRLYEKISSSADTSDPSTMISVEREMKQFAERYPNDPRIDEVARWQAELEMYRLQRQLENRARRRSTASGLPIEQLYLDILLLMRSEPDRAAERLRALVDLYDSTSALDEEQARYLRLARRQLEQLDQRAEAQAATHLPLVEERLSAARDAVASDPLRARRIYRGIIELYGEKPWAQTAVQAAESELKGLPSDP